MQKNALCPASAFQSCLHNGHMVHCVIGLSLCNIPNAQRVLIEVNTKGGTWQDFKERKRDQSMVEVEEGHLAKPLNAGADLYNGGGASLSAEQQQ